MNEDSKVLEEFTYIDDVYFDNSYLTVTKDEDELVIESFDVHSDTVLRMTPQQALAFSLDLGAMAAKMLNDQSEEDLVEV